MDRRADKLEENILALFKQACRQGRLDVAEHLLRALEASSEKGSRAGLSRGREALINAYRTVAKLR